MLEVKHLSAGYQGKSIIHDVSCSFRPGTITSILGANGSGKSTLLKAILGLNERLDGEILLDGCDLRKQKDFAARNLAYLSQLHTAPNLTVGKVVLHGRFSHLRYPRRYTKEDLAICDAVMEEVGIYHRKDQFLDALSGGEQQKVYLAMALAKQARVYLFDEPNTFLDVRHQLSLLEQMKKLRSQGSTVIAVFHDMNFAMSLSDAVLVMDQGVIAGQGSPEEILSSGVLERSLGVRCEKLTASDGTSHYFLRTINT